MRSNKRLNGDQALTDYSEPTMMLDVSQPHAKHSYPRNGKGLNRDNNMEEVLHIYETASNVTSSFDADKSMQSLEKSMGSKLSNENTIFALFGVPLSSIENLDVLTRKIEAGDYDEIKKGMTSVEWKAVMAVIEAEWKKLLADPISYVGAAGASSSKPSTGKANFCHLVSDNVFDGFQLSILMNVVRTFDSTKGQEDVLESGPWMIRNNSIILKKWTMNTRPCTEELTLIPPIKQKVIFDLKSHGNSQKANDGNIVHSVSKEKPSKAANVPSSSYTCGSAKNGGL
ncbi:zinc knuckle CX2CX4HX4C containing protein [Tanacetum coccineum]|uniref:Zinc knuckle CX2CX4HX4C containing protein n=1 Tax=Tanacetum coccineum TaxID=301880 RepID=A0ABQ4WTC9_9ASTR